MENALATAWWLLFWTALGLCVGSFLNAVVYRLPRGKSLTLPLWSSCPNCATRIAWYDNLPILSFLRLRGRCRHCGEPISTRYLVIEALMAIVVLLLLDAFFIGSVRAGLSQSEFGLTDRLSYDWPNLVGHVALFACLLALSAIDIEHYWVDIRFTNFVTIAGFVTHALWTPRHSAAWPRCSDPVAVMAAGAMVGLGVTWFLLRRMRRGEQMPEAAPEAPAPAPNIVPDGTTIESHEAPPPELIGRPSVGSRLGGGLFVLVVIGLLVALFLAETKAAKVAFMPRALLPLGIIFVLVLSQAIVARESDTQIAAALEEERPAARRTVVAEFAFFLPAIVLGGAGLWLASGEHSKAISDIIHTHFRLGNLAMFRHWAPLEGLATAAAGYVIAGALGWAVRIFFTLVFGREAFGTGDIHMMAAAGSVAGWQVVVLGFFLTCGLALAGWLLALPFKRTRALPLGPWLSLGFLVVVLFYDWILELPVMARAIDTANFFLRQAGW